jgi:hypothetical protein
MRVIVRLRPPASWRKHSGPSLPPSLEERLRRLGNAALATPYYSQSLRAGQILGASGLQDLPSITLRDFLDHRSSFINPRSRQAAATFHNPFPVALKTAIVGVPLQSAATVKVIPAAQWQWLHNGNTQLLAATVPVLRRMAAGVLSGSFELPQLSHGIVILNTLEHGVLMSSERDLLWTLFGVPLFEQWLGLDGELLACECEAHHGMHLEQDALELEQSESGELILTSYQALRTPALRLHSGWSANLLTEPCACGLSTPRLVDLRRISTDRQLPHQSSEERFPPAGYSQTQTMAAGAA